VAVVGDPETPLGKWKPPLLHRLLVRGEAAIAPAGIALAAILLGVVAAGGWWTYRTQRLALEDARADQINAVSNLLGQTCEQLLAHSELSTVRLLVSDAAYRYQLTRCRIVLPDGSVVASSDASQVSPMKMPPTWGEKTAPDPLPSPEGVVALTSPLKIPGRGVAYLQVSGRIDRPFWAYWETQVGVGAIGGMSMVLLLVVYRGVRGRLRAFGAVREALMAAARGMAGVSEGQANSGVPASALLVSPDLGPEARAWNEMVQERERARKQSVAERARDTLGRRRQAKGDLDAACDAMSHGLLLVDDKFCVKYANGAAASFLGADREKLVGGEISKYLQVESVLEAIRGTAGGTVRRRITLDVERKDDPAPGSAAKGQANRRDGAGGGEAPGAGSAGVLRFSIRPVRREDSASAMVLIEDITQQKAAEEARHAFVAQATHELRTPLTNIRLYVETAIEEGETDAAMRSKCLNVINGEARRLERIVGEMLSVAEMEAGSFKLREDDVRLDALFEELKADYDSQAKEKRITLTFNLSPKLPVLHGDRDKVALALHNLIGNALKYTPDGGRVVVTADADAKQLSVSVKDTGIGIGPEDQERIFERFYRAKDKRVAKITGTGLGLTLAREVARLHGGEIEVESVLNQGSTFTLTLPLKAEAA
jgi:signal transduction histidine kinase